MFNGTVASFEPKGIAISAMRAAVAPPARVRGDKDDDDDEKYATDILVEDMQMPCRRMITGKFWSRRTKQFLSSAARLHSRHRRQNVHDSRWKLDVALLF